MIYAYECATCHKQFDVIKPAREFERAESCECGAIATRVFAPSANAIFKSKGLESAPAYNPGLGCVVKNAKHKDYLLKSRNLVEIGNDYGSGEKMQTEHDKAREEKREKSWETA